MSVRALEQGLRRHEPRWSRHDAELVGDRGASVAEGAVAVGARTRKIAWLGPAIRLTCSAKAAPLACSIRSA